MIRHAGLTAALAVLALAIPMVEPALGALLIPAIGTAPLLKPGLTTTVQAAIAMAAIAMLADQEQSLAMRAKPLPKHHFALRRRHRSGRAGLDNGDPSVAP